MTIAYLGNIRNTNIIDVSDVVINLMLDSDNLHTNRYRNVGRN